MCNNETFFHFFKQDHGLLKKSDKTRREKTRDERNKQSKNRKRLHELRREQRSKGKKRKILKLEDDV